MGVSRSHLTVWNWFLKELVVIELVGFSRRKWNAGVCYRVYKNPTITDPSSESSKSNPHILTLFIQDQYYIILPSTSRVFQVISYLHVFYSKCCFHVSHISFMLHVPCVSPPPSFDRSCNMCWRAQFFTSHCTCLSRQPYSWLPKNIFQSGIVFLCWPHFIPSKLALNVP